MSNPVLDSVLAFNEKFSSEFPFGHLPIPPAKNLAILTCMDARIDAHALTGLAIGDAHIIRNAGGRASDDAIRSLVISYKLLGTNTFLVIHHTNCGMLMFKNEDIRGFLRQSLTPVQISAEGFKDVGEGPGSDAADSIDFLTIDSEEQGVIDDVNRIADHPLVPNTIPVLGFIYDVVTGKLTPVDGAQRNV